MENGNNQDSGKMFIPMSRVLRINVLKIVLYCGSQFLPSDLKVQQRLKLVIPMTDNRIIFTSTSYLKFSNTGELLW